MNKIFMVLKLSSQENPQKNKKVKKKKKKKIQYRTKNGSKYVI